MTPLSTVLCNVRDLPVIEALPQFYRVYEYGLLEAQSQSPYEWGSVRSGDSRVRFLAFSQLNLDAFAAFNGGDSGSGPRSLEMKHGCLAISVPTLAYLKEAFQMILYKISSNMTVYPPHFKIFTHTSISGDFLIKYEVA